VICVPTPLRKSRHTLGRERQVEVAPDLEPARLKKRTQHLVGRSRIGRALEDDQPAGPEVPPDLAGGSDHAKDITKLVGGVTPGCVRLAALLYRQIVAQVTEVSSPRVAELSKLDENTFRSVNIALANELALICHRLGVDVWEVTAAAATKPFGFLPFCPGPGIGGHCIPIDPFYLSWKARLNSYEAKFTGLADEINRAMPDHVVGLLTDALNDRGQHVRGAGILVLGVAYKRGVGDIRQSPAVEIIQTLRKKGARVAYTDPFVPRLDCGRHAYRRHHDHGAPPQRRRHPDPDGSPGVRLRAGRRGSHPRRRHAEPNRQPRRAAGSGSEAVNPQAAGPSDQLSPSQGSPVSEVAWRRSCWLASGAATR